MTTARQSLVIGALFVWVAACAHTNTREGALAAAVHDLDCEPSRLMATEYAQNTATVEGCGRQGHFMFLHGAWRLSSRCQQRETPSIPSCCSPNRGGEWTCVNECRGFEECARLVE